MLSQIKGVIASGPLCYICNGDEHEIATKQFIYFAL